MGFIKYEDIQVGKVIRFDQTSLTDAVVERTDKNHVTVTQLDKQENAVLIFTKNLAEETFEISSIKEDFWYITLDGKHVDQINGTKYSSLYVEQMTPHQMGIKLKTGN